MAEFETIKTNLNDILTFDRSKFTVVGAPTITDDGIASGFSASNFLQKKGISIKNNWEIISPKFLYRVDTTGERGIFFLGTISSSGDGFVRTAILRNGRIACNVSSSDWNNQIIYADILVNATTNDYIQTKIGCKNGEYYIYHRINDNGWQLDNKKTSTVLLNITNKTLNICDSTYNGSIDLKQFSITVDGVEIFNGNKTGIDQIKTDNFTKVGNPTITADGIASGFSANNTIATPNIAIPSNRKNITYAMRAIYSETRNSASGTKILSTLGLISKGVGLRFGISSDGRWLMLDGLNNSFPAEPLGITLKTGDILDLRFSFTENSLSYRVLVNNTPTCSGVKSVALDNFNSLKTMSLFIGYNTNYFYTGSIDLNSFKIYVDGNLVYQPTLRIPYKLAIDNRKIISPYHEYLIEDNQDILKDHDYILESNFPIITEIPKRTPENTNIIPRDLKSFNITRDFIQSLIPDNIRDTWTFERVADLIYAVISDETATGKEILSYYDDMEYFNTDITKLSVPMKERKLNDLGFSYLSELYQDEESLNNLGVFLNLIKTLKGDIRGFELILQLLGLNCSISSWVKDPNLEIFTMQVLFKSSGQTLNLNKTTNDKEIQGKKYFDWEGYYTTNSTEPNYERANIIKIFGSDLPIYSSLTGEMSNISLSGYPYLKLKDEYKDIIFEIETTDSIYNSMEFIRCLNSGGTLLSLLKSEDGLLGSYILEPNTKYYIRLTNLTENSYSYSIKTEEEMEFTPLTIINLDEQIDSIDICRTFNGTLFFGTSYISDFESNITYFAKNITSEYSIDKPHVLVGDTVYSLRDTTLTPVGIVLNTDETDNVTKNILISSIVSESNASRNMIQKIQKLARNYLAPWVNIELATVQDITISNNYYSAGFLREKNYKTFEVIRSL